MSHPQPAILSATPKHARYMLFKLQNPDATRNCLQELRAIIDGDNIVLGVGASLVESLDKSIEGLRGFSPISCKGLDIPATPAALWCWLRGDDCGEIFHQSRLVESLLMPAFSMVECLDSFKFSENRDLSGYEDGTENPEGEDAIKAAVVQGRGAGLDGSSFVAVQQWLHDFENFDAMTTEEQDDCIGRHVEDNEEFDEAPESAHVKRSAQESYDPEAFMLRRSMPWTSDTQGGLMFVAFGHSFDAFEAVMNRMAGKDDGIKDGLFTFTRPISGSYFWCPPMNSDGLDLSALGL